MRALGCMHTNPTVNMCRVGLASTSDGQQQTATVCHSSSSKTAILLPTISTCDTGM